MNRLQYVGEVTGSHPCCSVLNEYLMPIARGQRTVFLHGETLERSKGRSRGRVRSNTGERATMEETDGGKGRNLEITRPNDKKTVEEGKTTDSFRWKKGSFGRVATRKEERRGEGTAGQSVKIRALRERLIKGCKLTNGNDAAV